MTETSNNQTEAGTSSRDASSLSRAQTEGSSALDFVTSTITTVPPSIDVIVPEPPSTENITPTLEEQQSMDSRLAIKIVQERLAHHQSQENNGIQNQEVLLPPPSNVNSRQDIKSSKRASSSPVLPSVGEENVISSNQQVAMPHLQAQTTPGAVRVAGMNPQVDSSITEEGLLGVNNDSIGVSSKSNKSTARPFEPDVPVEAQLVQDDSRRNQESDRPPDELYYEAQPVSRTNPTFGDVIRNPKICGAFVAIMLAMTCLAVGLSVGLIKRSNSNTSDSTPPPPGPAVGDYNETTTLAPTLNATNNPNTTYFHTTIQTPFTDKLLDISIQIIVSDAASPQAAANAWMTLDPNTYPHNRSLARYALATLFFATDGWNWLNNTGWLSYEIHECDWFQSHPTTTCDEDGKHTILNLTSNRLNGIANTRELLLYLLNVHTIDVSNNSLGGDAPPLLNEREGVRYLDYSRNLLTGRISAEFGWENPNLRVMRIHHNQLRGAIPPSLYSILPNAEEISLGFNNFTGGIPDRLLRNNTKLRILDFGDNLLDGTIPKSLQHLIDLEVLDVSGNEGVTGTIPDELTSCTDLKVLDVEDTSLTGTVPAGLCQLEESQQLDVIADCDKLSCCQV